MTDSVLLLILRILRKLGEAVRLADNDGQLNANQEFDDHIDHVADSSVRQRLSSARTSINNAAAEAAFREFAQVSDEFLPMQDAFRHGIDLADEGEASLFFPAAATHLGQVAGLVSKLKDDLAALKEQFGDLGAAFGDSDIIAVVTEANATKELLEEIVDELDG